MDWPRTAENVMRSGDYVITRESVFGDLDYLAEHSGKLIALCSDAEAAKAVCVAHQQAHAEAT